MEDHNDPFLDLSIRSDIITMVIGSLPLSDRCNCALVCKAWAEAATAATDSIILKHSWRDLSGLQTWLEKHGNQITVLQLHDCQRAALTALPCCAKLQDLLLHGSSYHSVTVASRVWGDLASATRLTSISLIHVQTACQQADVVAALAALPNLEQLTWRYVSCSNQLELSDGSLLQQTTQLTSLDLMDVTAAALQHLGSLTKLQHLRIRAAQCWAAAGCPGLQELKALTSRKLDSLPDLPASTIQLTALQQLDVAMTISTPSQLLVLTGLTKLRVWQVTDLSAQSSALNLPGLQHLELSGGFLNSTMPMSFLASCTRLQVMKLHWLKLKGPGSLTASPLLQHLELFECKLAGCYRWWGDGAVDTVSWQQVFPGPGQLPHLTSLRLFSYKPDLQQPDTEGVAACCSNLKALDLSYQGSFASALAGWAQLPGLTQMHLHRAEGEDYGVLAQLTGLRQLAISESVTLSVAKLRQLAALNQLTSLGFSTLCPGQLSMLAQHLMKDRVADLPGFYYAIVNKAPTGFPSDISHRLLDICDVLDACEGLNVAALIEAACSLVHHGSSGSSAGEGSKPLRAVTAEALLAAAAALKGD